MRVHETTKSCHSSDAFSPIFRVISSAAFFLLRDTAARHARAPTGRTLGGLGSGGRGGLREGIGGDQIERERGRREGTEVREEGERRGDKMSSQQNEAIKEQKTATNHRIHSRSDKSGHSHTKTSLANPSFACAQTHSQTHSFAQVHTNTRTQPHSHNRIRTKRIHTCTLTYALIIGGGDRFGAVKDAGLHVVGRSDAGTRVLLLLADRDREHRESTQRATGCIECGVWVMGGENESVYVWQTER